MDEKLIFKTYAGSKLYGTDSECSDTDIKGVFIPYKEDLILGKAPKHYSVSSNNQKEKNNKADIDETYYSIHYFLELVSKGETNAIDLLFAYTNWEKVIISTKEWQTIIDNIDKLITKNIKSYLGYCKSQSIKYSIKGSKLKNYKSFMDFCKKHYYDSYENGIRKSLYSVLNDFLGHDSIENYIPKVGEDRIKANINLSCLFGEHCYFITADNKESYISISDIKFGLDEKISDVYQKVKRTIESYGKRAEKASIDNGADYKAISHCVRVILQVEELLTTNKITFPLINREFIKSIKYKTTSMKYDEIMKWIDNHIMHIEEVLLPKSTLREKSDMKWINNFILNLYGEQQHE